MKATFYILICLILTSCFSSVDPKLQARYIETKNSFDNQLIKHLPKVLPDEYNGFGYSPGESGDYSMSKYLHIKLRFNYKRKYILEKERLIKNSIYSINSTDTCSIKVLAESIRSKSDFNNRVKNINNDCARGYPIPSFEYVNFDDESYRRTSKVHVIDADTTLFLINPDRPKTSYLPDNWRKGYSVGFTTNDDYLLIDYWIVVW